MRNPETNPFSLFFKTISKHYSGVIAILLVTCTCYLWFCEKTVPSALENMTFVVISFLFGKNVSSRERTQNSTE